MTMTPGELREILQDVLSEHARVTPELHGRHHDWIAQQIKASEDQAVADLEAARVKRDFYLSMAKALAGTGMVALGGYLTGIFSKFWDLISAGLRV